MAVPAAQVFAELITPHPPAHTPRLMSRAVVFGASIAGLMAARVLSDHADEVLVVERDDSEATAEPRPGVPQGTQVHALLPAGAIQLERWFPGFNAEAVSLGAVVPPGDGSRNRFYVDGTLRTAPQSEQEAPVLVTTRPFLESLVRKRTVAVPNITLVSGRAEGIEFTGDRVTGARYVASDGTEVTVDADFVVDATGRSSRLSDWLEAAGWEKPPMRRMPIKLNYATAMFAYDETIAPVWTEVSTVGADSASGRKARIGGFNRVEGDRWIMLVAGYGDDRPSRDVEEYRERCRRDFPAEFGQIADKATMLTEVITYHQADSRRRDYHELKRFPAGVIAAGDAVASFNPVYGQGMTSAMLHASCLSRYLTSSPSLDEPAFEYFGYVRVIVDAAWQSSTFADLELPHVDGPYPRFYRLIRWVSGKVFKASMTDRVVNDEMGKVMQMLAHPSALARPGLVLRAFWKSVFPARA